MAEEGKSWEEVIRSMLPPGAPLLDEDHLDYSIAVEYKGPPVPFDLPKIQPLDPKSAPDPKPPRRPPVPRATSSSAAYLRREVPLETDGGEGDEDPSSREVSDRGSSPRDAAEEARRPPVVTFNEEREDEGESQPTSSYPSGALPEQRREGKRGACSRCGKVSILKEREACLVCDARYCCNCVLRAMGSMPEGRKCVGCIGQPIEEPKRSSLGKPSRMLCKLCDPLEVRQIMKAERDCPANQLRPEQLIINGWQLRQEELDEILGCPNPPQKLKPGRYWYDKDSGLWGKEGQKPDRIITSKLNVGGKLQQDASNGNTKVFINGREITKLELRVLKFFRFIL